MDYVLARGLKNELLRELDRRVDNVISKFISSAKDTKAGRRRTYWNSFVSEIDGVFGNYLISKYTGGTKRKPYVAISSIEVNKEKRFNSWTEECVQSSQMLINYDPWFCDVLPIGWSISDHTIQRIYQRAYRATEFSGETRNIYSVINELAYVPIWSGFWTRYGFTLFQRTDLMKYYPVIPCHSGLFLCEMLRGKIHQVEIRTFVSDMMLSDSQLELKKILIDLSEDYLNSSLPYCPAIDIWGVDKGEEISYGFNQRVSKYDDLIEAHIISKEICNKVFNDVSENIG